MSRWVYAGLVCLMWSPLQLPTSETVILVSMSPMRSDRTGADFSSMFRLTTQAGGVLFDMDSDGARERIAWTEAGSEVAFLAIDLNENGVVDNGRELFGAHTTPRARTGIDAIGEIMSVAHPKQFEGLISQPDPVYSKLLLWRDRNHNGLSEIDELRPAKETISAVGRAYVAFNRQDGRGNEFRYQGWFEIRTAPGMNESVTSRESDDRRRWLYEVSLAKN